MSVSECTGFLNGLSLMEVSITIAWNSRETAHCTLLKLLKFRFTNALDFIVKSSRMLYEN